jgi:hypothetical protein
MTAPKDDGGSAFPGVKTVIGMIEPQPTPGMSLRDWFAGQALTGMLLAPTAVPRDRAAEIIARSAYAMADALLAARKP